MWQDYNGQMNFAAVEGEYRTFAQGTSKEETAASRGHRRFGGFSMGSVTTWHTFQYCQPLQTRSPQY